MAAEDKQPQKRGLLGAGYGAAYGAPVAPLYSHGGLGLYNHAPLSAGLYGGHGLGGPYGGGLYGGGLYGGGLYGGGLYGGGLYGGGLYGAPLARHVAPAIGFGGAPWLGHGGYLH